MQSKKPLPNPPLPETNDLASANECTGLMPAAVQTQEEAQHYTSLYDIHHHIPSWEHRDELKH